VVARQAGVERISNPSGLKEDGLEIRPTAALAGGSRLEKLTHLPSSCGGRTLAAPLPRG